MHYMFGDICAAQTHPTGDSVVQRGRQGIDRYAIVAGRTDIGEYHWTIYISQAHRLSETCALFHG